MTMGGGLNNRMRPDGQKAPSAESYCQIDLDSDNGNLRLDLKVDLYRLHDTYELLSRESCSDIMMRGHLSNSSE